MPRLDQLAFAAAAAALAVTPASAASAGRWVSVCTAHGAMSRLVPDDGRLPSRRDTQACHAACTLARKRADDQKP